MNPAIRTFSQLEKKLQGKFFFREDGPDNAVRMLYATDASIYQEKPLAVALPASTDDIKELIRFASENHFTLIPRAAGTSLAGQVVGNGIVVDISTGWDKVIRLHPDEKWVIVEPGIIRDDLNKHLLQYGLMFGPETSTASRAMIGGMVGNNSCGLHSIKWGDTRDVLLEATVLLSDGSEVTFKNRSPDERKAGSNPAQGLEARIYQRIAALLDDKENRKIIEEGFPGKKVQRRNTGYALDSLLEPDGHLNLCKLLSGSEGTLCFFTSLKLRLIDIPPKENVLLCLHFSSLRECLEANVDVMKHQPYASELTDKRILDFTKGHPVYSANRFFIQGDPEAILMVEFFAGTVQEAVALAERLVDELRAKGLGFAYPILKGKEVRSAWEIRKAGLGLLRNMPGDLQPVNVIEDCAVSVEDLPAYAEDIMRLLRRHGLSASYYAHAGAGELHIEPMINLKEAEGQVLFRQLLAETVVLVKKYGGSLSGEHGDGRLRGEFITDAMGKAVYDLFLQVKEIFDPLNVFNAGKITGSPPMNTHLRYSSGLKSKPIETVFDFRRQEGILRLAEKCSGSGDCRKTALSGGTMCPSYMATRLEKDTTRARANILRQFLTDPGDPHPFDHEEIDQVMDLCLSCKGCKTECPSGVDVAKMKAEFLQHYYDANGTPFRTRMIGRFTRINKLASSVPWLYNFVLEHKITARFIKALMGFSPERSLPLLHKQSFRKWFRAWKKDNQLVTCKKTVFLFVDEFTDYNDVEMGQKAVMLLSGLGYDVQVPAHEESGRVFISKGLLYEARKVAIKNVEMLWPVVRDGGVLIGLEPSAILSLRDEYLDLVPDSLRKKAEQLSRQSFYIDEFLYQEIGNNSIHADQFTQRTVRMILHGHCHQKALSKLSATFSVLSLPANYSVKILPSGCCGMAGSFGYEKEHYAISMKIGELVLFPAVRKAAIGTIIVAPGTSCRHQIKDGTGQRAFHPVEILWDALVKPEENKACLLGSARR